MLIAEKIERKKKEAKRYSRISKSSRPFFVLANNKNAILTNSSVAVEELCKSEYSIVSFFINGSETEYI